VRVVPVPGVCDMSLRCSRRGRWRDEEGGGVECVRERERGRGVRGDGGTEDRGRRDGGTEGRRDSDESWRPPPATLGRLTPAQLERFGRRVRLLVRRRPAGNDVLAERCVALVCDVPEVQRCDIDQLLVVTFTDAAAEEMRTRIRRRCGGGWMNGRG